MPLYEFQCTKCKRKVEVIQSFSDPPPARCLHCGGTLAKLLSSPAVQFKGSGFYVTDYGRSGGKADDSSKEKEGDSSKGNEGAGGAPAGAGAEAKGDQEGDSTKGKTDSGSSTASGGATAKASPEPSSRSKKNNKRK